MSLIVRVLVAVIALVSGILTFLGVIASALLIFPVEMWREVEVQSIPFAQWTMQELNLVLGVCLLLFISMLAAALAIAVVWRFLGASQ